MPVKESTEIATDLDPLLAELTKIRDEYPRGPGKDGEQRVLRKIQATA